MKKRSCLSALVAPLLLVSGGCALLPRKTNTSAQRPNWIENWSVQYPSDAYLAGVGVGYSQASAEDFARGEIAKIFSAQVNVQESASQSETDQSGAKGELSSLTSSASQNVKTISHKVLKGAVIAADWQDPSSKQYYALAVLDRQKASASVSQQINDLDSQINQLKSAMSQAATKLAKAKSAMGIVAALAKRRELSAELRVVGQSGESIPPPVGAAAAQDGAQKALASLNVAVNIQGDDSGEITTGIIQGLGRLGILARPAQANEPKLDIAVTGSIFTAQENLGDSPWKRARSEADIRVKDALNSKTIAAIRPSAREDSRDYQTAQERSLESLARTCAQQIESALSDYLSGS